MHTQTHMITSSAPPGRMGYSNTHVVFMRAHVHVRAYAHTHAHTHTQGYTYTPISDACNTVFSDARALLESVIEDELVGNRTHASSDTDLILPTSLGRPHFAALRGGYCRLGSWH